jgi:hypothetical protein
MSLLLPSNSRSLERAFDASLGASKMQKQKLTGSRDDKGERGAAIQINYQT